MFVKTDQIYYTSIRQKIRTCLGRKMVMFWNTVIFIKRWHRIKQILSVENEQFLPHDSSVAQC